METSCTDSTVHFVCHSVFTPARQILNMRYVMISAANQVAAFIQHLLRFSRSPILILHPFLTMTVFNCHGPLSSLTTNLPLQRRPHFEDKPPQKRRKLNEQTDFKSVVAEAAAAVLPMDVESSSSDMMEVDSSVEELLQVCVIYCVIR